MINISEAYIEFQDYIKNDIINPIPRGGLWYNLLLAGGGGIILQSGVVTRLTKQQ